MYVNRFPRNIGSTNHLHTELTPQYSIKVSAIPRRKLEMRKYCCASHVFSTVRDTVNMNNVLLGRTLYFSTSTCIW